MSAKCLHVLGFEGKPTVTCFLRSHNLVIICGTDDGVLHLWGEDKLRHCNLRWSLEDFSENILKPSISKGSIISENIHMSPIVKVEFASSNEDYPILIGDLLSIDEDGFIFMW